MFPHLVSVNLPPTRCARIKKADWFFIGGSARRK